MKGLVLDKTEEGGWNSPTQNTNIQARMQLTYPGNAACKLGHNLVVK